MANTTIRFLPETLLLFLVVGVAGCEAPTAQKEWGARKGGLKLTLDKKNEQQPANATATTSDETATSQQLKAPEPSVQIPSQTETDWGKRIGGLKLTIGKSKREADVDMATSGYSAQPDRFSQRIHALLKSTPLIDGHNDLPWAIRETDRSLSAIDLNGDLRTGSPGFHTDLPRMRAGGVGGQFWSVYVPSTITGPSAFKAVMEQIDLVNRMVEEHPQQLEQALTADDIVRIHGAGKIASLIGVEGGHAIDDSLAMLRQLHAAGARYMTLTHNDNTLWADSATAPPRAGGLSPFGEEVVCAMNRLGMMVDLSHSSREARLDAMRVSAAPMIYSHASAFGLVSHPQNVDDELLRMLRADGGVVMITFVERFISSRSLAWRAAREAEEARQRVLHPGNPEGARSAVDAWIASNPPVRATLADVADHIEHVRAVAGIDHVGIGADFDGTPTLPVGLEGVETYPSLLGELMRRGWTDADIRKLAGENLLRVMRETERVAVRLQQQRRPSEDRVAAQDLHPQSGQNLPTRFCDHRGGKQA